MTSVRKYPVIKFENPNNGRFYYLHVQKDLLGDVVLSSIRGGKFHRVERKIALNCEIEINKEIERITKIRLKRGYQLST